MTRRPPANADEDTLIMRRLRADRPPGKRRTALRSPSTWLGLAMLAILLGGVAAWVLHGLGPPSVQPIIATAPAAQQPAPAQQQAPPQQQALLPPQPPAPRVTDARLAEIDGLRHSGAAVYRLVENPRILLVDFPTLAEQGRAMNRLAALIEKNGMPHDRVLSEPEMTLAVPNPDTYYLAHDYAATSLARFFSLAAAEAQPLNRQESDLLALLVGAGVIERAGAGYVATTPEMAVVTLVQAGTSGVPAGELVDASLRDTMLRHEVSHGEFFTNPAYRAHCERFWRERMSEAERALFRSFLAGNGYDPANETLMINEMQAYLMHTPDPRAFSAALLHVTPEKLADLRRRFMNPQPPTPLLGGKAPSGG
ncbi:MAG TPA: hypothetical protein VE914_02825 [Candidatus Angelobacter sp.]|nr:hypothetical protein [Candidatus Angelobacter sp.]